MVFELVWSKLGSTTLESAGDSIDTGTIESKKFIVALSHSLASTSNINHLYRFNNDSTAKYSDRYSANGGTDVTTTNYNFMTSSYGGAFGDHFNISYIVNISGEEKLKISFNTSQNTTGAGNAPRRLEAVGKYVPSPDADITQIDIDNSGSDDYDTDSNLTALGTD